MAARSDRMDAIVSLSKRRGFVYPSSEIYGGLRASWDYGPLGVELKNNIKRLWWRSMVMERDDIVGLDSSVILAREVWEASGHVTEFVDPLTECTSCHKRFRTDHLIEAYEAKHGRPPENGLAGLTCPNCGNKGTFTEPRMFSGLLRTYLGPVEDESGLAYLRPETAQGIFINYKNVLQSSRKKLPFGIGQIGKSFRNEITPGNFIFRTREFEQMEMEFFVRPGTDEDWHQTWIDTRFAWYSDLGIRKENLRLFEHPKEKLAHYSKRTVDVEYRFGFQGSEWGELEGIANRTDFDLTTHGRASGVDMSYLDQESGERFIPFVIEPAAGVDRAALVFLLDGYTEDEAPDAKGNLEKRTVLRLDPRVAPVKAAVLPLSRNADLSPLARDLAAALRKRWNTDFDDASAIGRRYRRQDEIGTPYCVTVDFDTLEDQAVTVRERDSMRQERVSISQLEAYLGERLPFFWRDRGAPAGPAVPGPSGSARVPARAPQLSSRASMTSSTRSNGAVPASVSGSHRGERRKTSAAARWKPSGRPAAAIAAAISVISASQRQPLAAAERAAPCTRPARAGWDSAHSSSSVPSTCSGARAPAPPAAALSCPWSRRRRPSSRPTPPRRRRPRPARRRACRRTAPRPRPPARPPGTAASRSPLPDRPGAGGGPMIPPSTNLAAPSTAATDRWSAARWRWRPRTGR